MTPQTNNFNLIRLALSVMVVVSHSFPVAGHAEPTYFFMSLGMLAVHGFFVISGYLIAQSYVRNPNILRFSWHRVLRIAPGLIVAYGFSLAAFWAFDGYSGNPITLVNASLWTLSWEALCYLAVGAIGFAGALTAGTFPAIFCALWLIYILHLGNDTRTFIFVATMVMMFVMGMFIAISERRISVPKAAAVAVAVLIMIYTQAGLNGLEWLIAQANFAYGPGFPLGGIRQALYIAALPFIFLYLALYAKPIKFVRADVSYGVYIYAWPVQEIVVKVLRDQGIVPSGLTVLALSLPPILVLSWLSWHLIEKRALSLKNLQFFNTRPTSSSDG